MSNPVTLRPILDVAHDLGLDPADVIPWGRHKAKVSLDAFTRRPGPAKGRLVLVSAINPTPAGEGKTTTSIALAMAMARRGRRVVAALREPSLGPVFGMKGGGTGGGHATLVPSADINLHFTGDLHAITSAHNLLAAMVDNALHHRDPHRPRPPLGALAPHPRHERPLPAPRDGGHGQGQRPRARGRV
jgi:formate--tetrahydrofolate ligase